MVSSNYPKRFGLATFELRSLDSHFQLSLAYYYRPCHPRMQHTSMRILSQLYLHGSIISDIKNTPSWLPCFRITLVVSLCRVLNYIIGTEDKPNSTEFVAPRIIENFETSKKLL
jgi:hypothetical protein